MPLIQKAMDMVRMAVEKARLLVPLQVSHLPLTQTALVIGGGIAGMTAATALACQGFVTHLVDKNPRLGGLLNDLEHIALNPDLLAGELVQAKIIRQVAECGVQVHVNTTIETIGGVVGNFHAQLQNGTGSGFDLTAGAVVVATSPVAFITVNPDTQARRPGPRDFRRLTKAACSGTAHAKYLPQDVLASRCRQN